jgi:Ca2+-binding RTX toxin-like protein
MNMISTAFPIETDASIKQENLVKKLVSVWEKKNSKTARAGGVSLMALTLAACGAEDDTPFAQSDIDAATAPLTEAVTAAQLGAAGALVAQAAAEATAAGALVAQATAEATAAGALVAQAAAEADAAAALVAQAAAEATAAAATIAQAAAEASLTTAQADLATAQASLATETAAKTTAEASLATVQASYDALVAPKSLSLTNSATADSLTGGEGDDTFTGLAGTLVAGDTIRDSKTTDNDTLTITDTDGTIGAFTVQSVENINLNINSLTAAVTVDATNYSGVTNLTVTRGDLTIGGANLTGNKQIDITGLDGTDVTTVTTGAATTIVNLTQQGASGVTLNADTASGAVTVVGAATVNAAGAGIGDTVTVTAQTQAQAGGTAALEAVANANAVTVNTGAATVVLADGGGGELLDGVIAITAASAGVVTVPNASGGVTVTAAGSGTNGVDVRTIDASGATISTTFAGTALAPQIIDLGAVATANTVATATVKATGVVSLETGVAAASVDALTLEGNGGAATYNITSTIAALTSIAATSDVTIAGNEAEFSGLTITGSSAAINLTAGTAGAIDADGWTTTTIGLGFNNANNAITAAAGQSYTVTVNQTGLDYDYVAAVVDQDISITAGDVNGTSTAVGTLTVGALNTTSGTATSGTVTITANESNMTATSVTASANQDIVINGDEDVNLGTVAAAKSINSQGSTGITTLTAGATALSVSTGSGNDALTLNGNGIHVVNAGAGNDAITVTSTAPTATINGEAGTDTITITDVDQYVVLGGSGTDTFNVGVAAAATIIGGADSDTLTITAGGVTMAAGFAVSGVENLNLSATNGTTSFTAAQFAGLSSSVVTANTTTDVLTITAAAAGSTLDLSAMTVATSSVPVVNIVAGAGNDTLTGSVYGETFNMNDLKGADTIEGGGTGTDTLTTNDTTIATPETGSGTTTGIVINMGSTSVTAVNLLSNTAQHLGKTVTEVAAGTIAYAYAAADTTNVNSTQVDQISGIENITIGDTAGKEYIVGSGGNNVISTNGGIDYVDGGAGNDTINGGDGVDILIGGDGDDTFTITALADLTDGANAVEDTITGGLGALDTIAFNGGVTLAALDDFTNKVSGVETFTANGAQTGAISLTTHSTFATDTGITTIDLSADTSATGTNVVSIAAGTVAGTTTITGSAGIDQVALRATSTDTVTGGAGVDTVNFTGGTTADVLNVVGASGTSNFDTVTNYVVASDRIALDGTLTTIGTAGGGTTAIQEDEAGAAANANGATYDLTAVLTLNTNAVDIITLDTAVLANKANANLDVGLTINDGTELLKCLVAAGVGSTASSITVDNAGDSFYILTDDGTDSYLYNVNSGADTLVTAAEIQLIADFAGATADGMSGAQLFIA